MSVYVERSDWMRTPGRMATFHLGRFWFFVNTADEGYITFSVNVGTFSFSWTLLRFHPDDEEATR